MPNFFVKLIWATIALSAFFAAEHFSIWWPYLIGAFATYRYMMVEIVECAVVGCMAAIEHYEQVTEAEMQAEIEDFEGTFAEPEETILDSQTFTARMRRFEEDEA